MPSTPIERQPMAALIEHLASVHHAPLKERLPRLVPLAWKVAEAHAAAHGPGLFHLASTVSALAEELLPHLQKEERVLFPWLLSGRGATAGAPIHAMLQEHEDARAALAAIRVLTDDFHVPADACRTWRALFAELAWLDQDLRVHIHLENDALFPRALRGEPPRADAALAG